MKTKTKTETETQYDEILELLSNAELAARNGGWATCSTFAKLAAAKAEEFAKYKRAFIPEIPTQQTHDN